MPEQRVDRERVLDAALAIVREQGETALSARAVAQRAGCSVQPLYSLFGDMDGLVRALYDHARAWVAAYNREHEHDGKNPFESNGLSHLRLARTERNLFHFLYLSPHMEAIGFGEVYAQRVSSRSAAMHRRAGTSVARGRPRALPQHDRVRARHGRHAGNGRAASPTTSCARAWTRHSAASLRWYGRERESGAPCVHLGETSRQRGARMAGRERMHGARRGERGRRRPTAARRSTLREARRQAKRARSDRARRQFRQHARRMALLVSFLLFPDHHLLLLAGVGHRRGAFGRGGCQHDRVCRSVPDGHRAAPRILRMAVRGGRLAGARGHRSGQAGEAGMAHAREVRHLGAVAVHHRHMRLDGGRVHGRRPAVRASLAAYR